MLLPEGCASETHDHRGARPRSRVACGPGQPPAKITSEELQVSVGHFRGLEGYEVLDKPDVAPEEWIAGLKSFKWAGLRVAHIFEGGWATASFKRKLTAEEMLEYDDGYLWFYYADIKRAAAHYLDLSEWGVTKSWVILKKAAPPSDREKRMKRRA